MFLPPSLHWQGHGAAVQRQQLSPPFGGENFDPFLRSHEKNRVLRSQEKTALKESADGGKATVPRSCASRTSAMALKYLGLAPGRWGAETQGDALGRAEGLSPALGTVAGVPGAWHCTATAPAKPFPAALCR